MKIFFIAICSLSISQFSFSQEVISTQGDSYTNANGSVDFTIGEVVTFTATDGNNDLTQGFHQTNWNFVELEDHQADFEVSIYPNPVEDELNIRAAEFQDVSYKLYDSRGRVVREDNLSGEFTGIAVTDLAPGGYQLELHKSNQDLLKTFKLIKNH